MKCPLCINIDLTMTERQGVEIDYCSKCRGVWLDRGELDKITELSSSQGQIKEERNRREELDDDDDDRDRDRDNFIGNRRRKESFLGDLFDF